MPETAETTTKDTVPQDTVRSRYSLVVLAAKRAKQIREGAPVLIETLSTNTLTIALEEIAAGKINSVVVEEPAAGEGRPSHAEASVSPASPFLVDDLVNASIARNREADGYLPDADETDDEAAADDDSMDRDTGNDGEE